MTPCDIFPLRSQQPCEGVYHYHYLPPLTPNLPLRIETLLFGHYALLPLPE